MLQKPAFLLTICLSLFAPLASLAQTSAVSNFQRQVKSTQVACPRLDCSRLSVHIESVPSWRMQSFATEQIESFATAMAEVANLWEDTILESGLVASTSYKLESVHKVLFKEKLIGYRIRFSAAAVDTENDNRVGRIVENAFVSLDASDAFRDEYELAQFVGTSK